MASRSRLRHAIACRSATSFSTTERSATSGCASALGPVPAELTSIPDHDWAGFGRALGLAGETVREPAEIETALARALVVNGPSLVDVKAEKNAPTPVEDFAAEAVHWSYHS
jgi:acetolactate synthase-1/2/3 large subunit